MPPLLLIQTGEAPQQLLGRCGGFAAWFAAAMRVEPARLRVTRVDAGAPLPAPEAVAGAVITGSAAMVTERADWSERTAHWIRAAMQIDLPLFGVCYGHQLMAHALGGTVGWLPAGREIGTRIVQRDTRAQTVFANDLPESFPAQTTHRQAVLEAPSGAVVVARSQRDPNQVLAYGPRAFSTQYHPEFRAAHMRAYIAMRADTLREEGLDPDALTDAVVETEAARASLERFANAALSGSGRRAAIA